MASKRRETGFAHNYQRFAWGTLALAALVALFSADGQAPQAMAAEGSITAEAAPVRPLGPPKSIQAPATGPDEAGPDAATSGTEAEGQPAAVSSPGPDAVLADAGRKGPGPVNFTAAQARKVAAASRSRSGSIDQGDERFGAPQQ